MRQIRTDLALEIREGMKAAPEGVRLEEETTRQGLRITRVVVEDERGAQALGRPAGRYVTVETGRDTALSPRGLRRLEREIAAQIRSLAGEALLGGSVLVAGLGNRAVTPDALGPRTVEKVFITRHIRAHLPKLLDDRAGDVCAVAPGVLGVTGIETAETLAALCARLRPALVIAVDALAAQNAWRIGCSVQLSDAGITPGSGVGNHRSALDESLLGAPVLAVGVPMVVYAATVAGDLLEGALGAAASEEDLARMERLLSSAEGSDLIVTPRNIDELVERTARLLAGALNCALHPDLSRREIAAFMEG